MCYKDNMTVEVYKQKGFDLVLTDDKTLVRTNLQVFLLYSPYAKKYLMNIRSRAVLCEFQDLNDLCGMFYNEKDEKVVQMMPTHLEAYV